MKHKGRRVKQLNLDQKLEIVHRILVDGEAQKDLAKEFRLSQALVSILVGKVRKKPEFLAELISKRAEKELLELKLADFIDGKREQGTQIRTVKQIRDDF